MTSDHHRGRRPLKELGRKAARGVAYRLTQLGAVAPAGFDLDAVPSADLALYFSDPPSRLYQVQQWLPVFETSPSLRTIVVVRHVESYRQLKAQTTLRVLLVPRYEDLMALYDRADFRAVIYVNNGWTNFQSLSFQQAVHIHVSHGESDKISMVSNQAKAYDRVFVAGEAAVRRHAAALAWFDQSHLIRVGRPQLDLPVPAAVPEVAGPTITYAPTWSGEDQANNYTSVDRYGARIVAAALAQPGARVLYKPHPRVLELTDEDVARGHAQILRLISAAAAADPSRGHQVLLEADVLGVIRQTDVMVADVSSVALDHLYLRPESPLVMTDRRSARARLLVDAPVAAAAHVVDDSSVHALEHDLAALIADDTMRPARDQARLLYFDGLGPGESTQRFWAELGRAITDHDAAMQTISRLRSVQEESSPTT